MCDLNEAFETSLEDSISDSEREAVEKILEDLNNHHIVDRVLTENERIQKLLMLFDEERNWERVREDHICKFDSF